MGCSSPQEKIEDEMMKLKLHRIEIQMERENKISQLSKITGKKTKYKNIPDYIDPEFAKKNYIIYDGEFMDKLSKKQIEKIEKTKVKVKRLSKSKAKTIKGKMN